MVDIWDNTHSAKWVAALLVTDFVPMILIALLLGSRRRSLRVRKLMIKGDLLRATVFCLLPFAGSALRVVALAGVAGFAGVLPARVVRRPAEPRPRRRAGERERLAPGGTTT